MGTKNHFYGVYDHAFLRQRLQKIAIADNAKPTVLDLLGPSAAVVVGAQAKLTKDAINSEEETISTTLQLSSKKENNRKKRIALYSDLSASSDTDFSLNAAAAKNKKKDFKRIKVQNSSDFNNTNYEKLFVCRFCNKCHKSKAGIIKHINIHSSLLCKYQTYIKGNCYVRLNKVDDKPNICKSENIVVHSRDRCIKFGHNFYYSVFKPKPRARNNNEQNSSIVFENVAKSNADCSLEISKNELNLRNRKGKMLRTKSSRTSNENIVVGEHNTKFTKCNSPNVTQPEKLCNQEATISSNCITSELQENECIDICDNSDSESCKIVSVEKNDNFAELDLSLRTPEYKTIQNVISVCLKKYLKNISIESVPRDVTDEQLDIFLKLKVLNIGKKIINNPGFSCIDILKYLEQKDLEIAWIPRVQNNIKKPDYVRIMIKLKDYNYTKQDDLGWQKLEGVHKENCNSEIISPAIIKKNSVKESLRGSTNMTSSSTMETKEALIKNIEETEGKNGYYKVLKILLNENPVLNPKQLSKKPLESESLNNTNNWKTTDVADQPVAINVENNVTSTDVHQMPIITSTVSLASAVQSESQEKSLELSPSVTNQNNKNGPNPPLDTVNIFPRIKVKPVTELMSDRVLSTIHKQQIHHENNVNRNQNMNMLLQHTSFCVGYTPEMSIPKPNYVKKDLVEVNSRQNGSTTSTNDKREYVVMNTVDLPCKRTDSPFTYFKDLLHINNIILLDVHATMSREFICLLKFKLMFQQELNSPVVLCLALYYSDKRFCLKVKDLNQKEIDICKLSANWQWEILKVYRGDVVTKLLENAQKIGPDVCYMTSKFLCYLKSIDFQNET